jgi:CheY-like chemotaxis protein
MEPVSSTPIILYAEDDHDDFETVKDALAQLTSHYTLLRAKNGLEVKSYLEEDSNAAPSLIVLDLNMPLMDGKETLQWLKQENQYQNIPVMVFTTSSREDDMKLCKDNDCTFFRKPTLYRDLLHIAQVMLKMCNQ